MQLPSASRDRLMLAPSRNLVPRFVVTVARSDPARSTSDNLPTFTLVVVLAVRSRCFTYTYKHMRRLLLLFPRFSTAEWLLVSVLDSGAEGPRFKSAPRRCPVTVLGKLFTPSVPRVHRAVKLVAPLLRVARVTVGLAESNGSL